MRSGLFRPIIVKLENRFDLETDRPATVRVKVKREVIRQPQKARVALSIRNAAEGDRGERVDLRVVVQHEAWS